MAMRWRYLDCCPADMGAVGFATHQTISAGGVFQVMQFAQGQDGEATANFLLDGSYMYTYQRPEFRLAFATENFAATGLADWLIQDLAHADGQNITIPSHSIPMQHNVTAAGSQIWITPWIASDGFLYVGSWLFLRVRRLAGSGADTIADDLNLFSLGFRYRIYA